MEDLRIDFEPMLGDDLRAQVMEGLHAFNYAATGHPASYSANFIVRGDGGDVLGGLLGYVWAGWLHVTYLWLAEPARGAGFGARLIGAAEAYAKKRGAIGSTLETFSFQARPFYEGLGYQVCGEIDDYPPGHTKFILKKALG